MYRSQVFRAEVWLMVLWLGGCATPSLTATVAPPESTVYVDGRQAGTQGHASMALGYYGHVAISAAVDPAPERERDYLEELRLIPVPVPFSRWLFPMDFLLEAVSYPFWDPYNHRVDVVLEPRTLLKPGVPDPNAEAIRSRARQARLER